MSELSGSQPIIDAPEQKAMKSSLRLINEIKTGVFGKEEKSEKFANKEGLK